MRRRLDSRQSRGEEFDRTTWVSFIAGNEAEQVERVRVIRSLLRNLLVEGGGSRELSRSMEFDGAGD